MSIVVDPNRRQVLAMLGTAVTAIGSGCTADVSSMEGPDEDSRLVENDSTTTQSRTSTSTEQPHTQQIPEPDQQEIRSTIRTKGWESGMRLSTVSGLREWTATNGTVGSANWREPDSEIGIELVSPTDVERTAANVSFEDPIDLTTMALSFGVHLERAAEETVNFQLLAPDSENYLSMERYITREEGAFRVDFAPSKVVGVPELTDIRGLRIKSYTGSEKPLTLHVGAPRLRKLQQRRGAVILTFDDGHFTQFEKAKPIMDEFGYPGVVGVIPWFVGNEIRMTWLQLHTLAEDGWEMASHPQIEDSPLTTLSKKERQETIERSKRWLSDEGFERGGETLIWPFGDFDEQLLETVGRSHRLAFGGGSSPSPWEITEPSWVPRVNGDNPADVRQAVDMAAGFGGVTTVMFHTIGQSRISTEEFQKELQYIEQADVDVILPSALVDAQPY